jgi:hypothetical protein
MRFYVGGCAHRSSDFRRLQSTLLTTGATASLLARLVAGIARQQMLPPQSISTIICVVIPSRVRRGRQMPTVRYAERFRMA